MFNLDWLMSYKRLSRHEALSGYYSTDQFWLCRPDLKEKMTLLKNKSSSLCGVWPWWHQCVPCTSQDGMENFFDSSQEIVISSHSWELASHTPYSKLISQTEAPVLSQSNLLLCSLGRERMGKVHWHGILMWKPDLLAGQSLFADPMALLVSITHISHSYLQVTTDSCWCIVSCSAMSLPFDLFLPYQIS